MPEVMFRKARNFQKEQPGRNVLPVIRREFLHVSIRTLQTFHRQIAENLFLSEIAQLFVQIINGKPNLLLRGHFLLHPDHHLPDQLLLTGDGPADIIRIRHFLSISLMPAAVQKEDTGLPSEFRQPQWTGHS